MTRTLPATMRAVTRLALALLAAGGLLAGLVVAAAPAAAAPAAADTSTQEYPVAVRCETFGDDGQQCSPRFSVTVETQGVLHARFIASPRGCSDFEVSFFHERVGGLPGAAIPTSGGDFLAPGASSREVVFGEGLSPGQYRVWVWAHGRPGGCNTGRLERWGGTLYVTTSGPPNPPPPQGGRPADRPLPTVQPGASGETVTTIQYLLRHHGAAVDVDGDFGPQTEAAVRAFQQAHDKTDLGPAGVVGPLSWPFLLVTVRSGDEGDAVRAVQAQLAARDGEVDVDGDFGPQTEAAVRAFQQANGLVPDGVVGLPTWAALLAAD